MGFRELFRSAFGFTGQEYDLAEVDVPTVDIAGATFPLIDWHPGWGYTQILPAVKRARQMTADTVAMMPAVAFRDGERLDDQPRIIRRPDPHLTYEEFVGEVTLSLIDWGNAYLWVTYDDTRNQPIAARVLDPNTVQVSWDRTGTMRLYTVNRQPVARRQIIHLALQRSRTDLIGSGPMQSSRLEGLAYMLRYAEDYFREASNPSGILYDPYETNDDAEALEKLAAWESGHDRGTRLLSGGLKWEPNTMTPGESEWTQSHAAGVVDIATLFGIPVPLLGVSLLGGASSIVYQNLTTIYQQWYRDTLAPTYVTRLNSALTRLVPRGTHVELDADALIRPDVQDRTELAIATYGAGIITVDEARAQIGYGPAAGGLPNAPQQSNREVTA